MNCWEAVIYGAYKAGLVSLGGLKKFYLKFIAISFSVDAPIENTLRKGPIFFYNPDDPDAPVPAAGDFVVFGTSSDHTTVATGKSPTGSPEVMSLWSQPDNKNFLQRTTIAKLIESGAKKNVSFFSPSWG